MRIQRLLIAACWILTAATIAHAQMNATIVWDAGPYEGPGDIVAFTAWYSCTRGYSAEVAATGTQAACDLRRVSDSDTCTALVGTNGDVDYTIGTPCNAGTQTVTAWIGASSARISKVYDQTNNNATRARKVGAAAPPEAGPDRTVLAVRVVDEHPSPSSDRSAHAAVAPGAGNELTVEPETASPVPAVHGPLNRVCAIAPCDIAARNAANSQR